MENLFQAFYLFLWYSFLGWILEVAYSAIRKRKFINRGYLNGPLCSVYGFAALVISWVLQDLRGNWLFLYLGSVIFGTVVEWIAGHFLEWQGNKKWWDYSHLKGNLGGYVCIRFSLLWGLLGTVGVTWGNGLLMMPYHALPQVLIRIVLIISAVVVAVDAVGSYAVIHKLKNMDAILEANDRIEEATVQFGHSVVGYIARRMEKAHPESIAKKTKVKPVVFAQGCGFYKLFMLLVVGAFLGDVVETIFCYVTAGELMSRSSLVWGQFSLVWGCAMSMATLMLYKYKDRSDGFLFGVGVLLGGAYEYFCSVLTETLFGTIFWDYSSYPLNLGGRINLLYCFFWGIAAVVWLKKVYPFLSGWIEKLPMKLGKILTWCLVLFLSVDVVVTCAAMARYQERKAGEPAENEISTYIDEVFPDEWMEERYRNMKLVE